MVSEQVRRTLLGFQINEITEHIVYGVLARKTKGKNAEVLKRISDDELRHYNEWREYTQVDVPRNRLAVLKFLIISKIFGLTFVMKMMEGGEVRAEEVYTEVTNAVPRAKDILQEEIEHEKLLVNMNR